MILVNTNDWELACALHGCCTACGCQIRPGTTTHVCPGEDDPIWRLHKSDKAGSWVVIKQPSTLAEVNEHL